jgi:hypothetical protein
MSRNLPALLGGTSIKDINCPLKSKKEEDRDGYVSVTHFGEHAATGCDKCCLLREIAIKFKVRITYFNTESDWTNVRFKTGPNVEYLSVDIFTPQGIDS